VSRRLASRLDRLVRAAKPGRCWWHAGQCVQHAVVGDGSRDPLEPELPGVCADCGRPIAWRVVCLVRVDVDRL